MNYTTYMKVRSKVTEMFAKATEYNSVNSVKRFYNMVEYKDGKMVEYGLYDHQTKKYVLFDIYSLEQPAQLKEFDVFFKTAVKLPAKK